MKLDYILLYLPFQTSPTSGNTHSEPKMQELFPGTSVFLPLATMLNAYSDSEKDADKLFHKLFDELFTDEDLVNAVPFGEKQGVPKRKCLLDQAKVKALKGNLLFLSYLTKI